MAGWAPAPTAEAPAQPPHFIFHLGHVASTLLARSLDEVRGTLVLREPALLRWAAAEALFTKIKHAVYVTFRPNYHRFDRFELNLRGHT